MGTRDDVVVYRKYVNDIAESMPPPRHTSTPLPSRRAAPIVRKYAGVLRVADVFVGSTTFVFLESLRLEEGVGPHVHP
ncbi:hypothetical protein GCM10011609_84580 [Lentzea pudingi]|uniref:Uncharacterized protein n=1 Tax=Lentzea pudingi TaxID=1789439 RepID=A0ABQ2IT16_9PSEU|nr:hypothetical protein [Lentzea pudingi]GGN28432.1 hypothetical protein GCM10011609_84580 [Lentzea pudingi]